MNPTILRHPDGRLFSATSDPVYPEPMPNLDGLADDAAVVAMAKTLWERTVLAREPWIERLIMLAMAYDGYHYRDAQANRELEVTNRCFGAVETVWPVLTRARPRPDFVPRQHMSEDVADRIEQLANWWQDLAANDRTRRLGTRAACKFGWNVTLLTVDQRTGMPFSQNWSLFDFYPDASAKDVLGSEYFFFAAPIPTRRLRAMFPEAAGRIRPDNLASPAYEAYQRPSIEFYQGSPRARGGTVYAPSATHPDATYPYNQGSASGSSPYVFSPYGQIQHTGSDTTFFVQLIIRDYGRQRTVYEGDWIEDHGEGQEQTRVPGYYDAGPDDPNSRPCCESGWRIISFTADGELLDQEPIDECFGGLPFEVGYDYEHEGRIDGVGEIDHIWPMNKAYNERKNLLNRAHRLEAAPPLIVSKGSGIKIDAAGVDAGDVLEPTRGSDIKWLTLDGPSEHQFAMLVTESKDMETVGGHHPVLTGQKPAGVEAGVALRELGDAAANRVQGKAPVHLDHWARVILKALRVMSKKLVQPIMFKAADGKDVSVTRDELEGMFSVMYREGAAAITSQREMEDKYLALYDRGLMPEYRVLKALNIPDYQKVAEEVIRRKMLEAALAAQSAATQPQENGKAQKNEPVGAGA